MEFGLLEEEESELPLYVHNLDAWFLSIYQYWYRKGFATMVASGLTHVFTLAFTIGFSGFLFAFVDWPEVWRCHDEKSCRPFRCYVRQSFDPRRRARDRLAAAYVVVFGIYWVWSCAAMLWTLREAWDLRTFYTVELGFDSDRAVRAARWRDVVKRLQDLQVRGRAPWRAFQTLQSGEKKVISATDVAVRIMRKENYLISMLNAGVLALELPAFTNGFLAKTRRLLRHRGPKASSYKPAVVAEPKTLEDRHHRCASNDEEKKSQRLEKRRASSFSVRKEDDDDDDSTANAAVLGRVRLTKTLEWSLHACILDHAFSAKTMTLRRAFIEDESALRRRFVVAGLLHVVLMPFVAAFMLMRFFLMHAQEWRHEKRYLGPREWSPVARWAFRELNELPHLFERRLHRSKPFADAYLRLFPMPVVATLARCVAFVAGALVATLVAVAALSDDALLLYVTVDAKRNLLWYLGLFSACFAAARTLVDDDATSLTTRAAESSSGGRRRRKNSPSSSAESFAEDAASSSSSSNNSNSSTGSHRRRTRPRSNSLLDDDDDDAEAGAADVFPSSSSQQQQQQQPGCSQQRHECRKEDSESDEELLAEVYGPQAFEQAMRRVAEHTRCFPDEWRGRCHAPEVRDAFARAFRYKAWLFADEILSVVLAPLVLCFSLPNCAREVLAYVRQNTVEIDGVGAVLAASLSGTDTRAGGNPVGPAPSESSSSSSSQLGGGDVKKTMWSRGRSRLASAFGRREQPREKQSELVEKGYPGRLLDGDDDRDVEAMPLIDDAFDDAAFANGISDLEFQNLTSDLQQPDFHHDDSPLT